LEEPSNAQLAEDEDGFLSGYALNGATPGLFKHLIFPLFQH
jgi:hypothetical protein